VTCDASGDLEGLDVVERMKSGSTGEYTATFRGKNVTVTSISSGLNTTDCIDNFVKYEDQHVNSMILALKTHCKIESIRRVLLEIIYYAVLKSANVIDQVGFCIVGPNNIQNHSIPFISYRSTSVGLKHGSAVVTVKETGAVLTSEVLMEMPYQLRLMYARDIVETITSKATSVPGGVGFTHFGNGNMAMVDGKLKIADVASFEVGDAECGNQGDETNSDGDAAPRWTRLKCPFNTECVNGTCLGYIDKINIRAICKTIFPSLLWDVDLFYMDTFCDDLTPKEILKYIYLNIEYENQ